MLSVLKDVVTKEAVAKVREYAASTMLLGAMLFGVCGTASAQSAAMIGGNQVQRMEEQQKGLAAEARQKKMESDAARLVEMAQKLKTSVDKTNKDVLSVDVIKEAERIEKLAREVREGMRQ